MMEFDHVVFNSLAAELELQPLTFNQANLVRKLLWDGMLEQAEDRQRDLDRLVRLGLAYRKPAPGGAETAVVPTTLLIGADQRGLLAQVGAD